MGMNSVTLTAHPCQTGARLFSGIGHSTVISSLGLSKGWCTEI